MHWSLTPFSTILLDCATSMNLVVLEHSSAPYSKQAAAFCQLPNKHVNLKSCREAAVLCADMMQEDEDNVRPAAAPPAAARAQASQQKTANTGAPGVLTTAQKVQVSATHTLIVCHTEQTYGLITLSRPMA